MKKRRKANKYRIAGAIILLLLVISGGTFAVVRAQQAERAYTALKGKEKAAEETATKSRNLSDIEEAQKLADQLHEGDKKLADKRLNKLKSDLMSLNNAKMAVDKAHQKPTDADVALAEKLVNQLSDEDLATDKAKLEQTLKADKELLAKNKAAAAAKAEAAKVAKETQNAKLIALTFDDGPNPTTTPQLLQTLKAKGVVATFFALGNAAQANPDLIKQEAAQGNEVASHTWDHKDLQSLSPAAAKQEIESAHNLIDKLTGQTVNLFRPPYGSYNKTTLSLTNLSAVNWSVDTNDWRYNSSAPVVQNALAAAHPGAIILMHDIHPWSVAAVPQIIDSLKAQGYRFVTVSKLLEARAGGAQPGQVYFGQ